MIPISRALQAGGIQAAYACYDEIKGRNGEGYLFDAHELFPLVYQIVSSKKIDLAIEVLKLNLHAFPDHAGSRQFLTRLVEKESEGQVNQKQ